MIYTIADIRALNLCYDPTRFLPEDWQGTALDILRVASYPMQDRLWIVTHWLDDRTLRLFAVWCARRALALKVNPDPRSINVCNVAEKFANGQANRQELDAAKDAAWDAAWDAAGIVAWAAARDAAGDAARGAAGDAAWDTAFDTAWEAAGVADWGVARDAAQAAQIQHLVEMLAEEEQSVAYG